MPSNLPTIASRTSTTSRSTNWARVALALCARAGCWACILLHIDAC